LNFIAIVRMKKMKELLQSRRFGYYLLFIAWYWGIQMTRLSSAETFVLMGSGHGEPPYDWMLYPLEFRILSVFSLILVLSCYVGWIWQRRKGRGEKWWTIIIKLAAFHVFFIFSMLVAKN